MYGNTRHAIGGKAFCGRKGCAEVPEQGQCASARRKEQTEEATLYDYLIGELTRGEREAPGIGWESSKSKGASALTVRWSLYIGYLEVANRVETLILNGGLYGLGRGIPVRLRLGQSLDCKDRGKQQIPRSARDDNATVGRGDFRLGTRCGGAL